MLRFLRRTFGRRSMQRYGRGAGRGAGRGGLGGEGDERDGGLRGAAAAAVVSGGFPSSPHPGGVAHGAGAPVHIPAAGGSKPVLQCRVLLLDGTEVSVELPKHAKGQELFDQIVYHLDLVETDYFGLQFMDASQVTVTFEGCIDQDQDFSFFYEASGEPVEFGKHSIGWTILNSLRNR